MVKDIDYKDTKRFSKLVSDYLSGDDKLHQFYKYFPSIKSCESQISARNSFLQEKRESLTAVLANEYRNLKTHKKVNNNIESLKNKSTFTVTTGHQLCLFTGPAYFIYKICSAINLSEQLNEKYPHYHFVPIYWMATEDNDIEEISTLNVMGEELKWKSSYEGISGDMPLNGLDEVFQKLKKIYPENNVNSKSVLEWFKYTYLSDNHNLSKATLCLVNELFGKYGLLVLDANAQGLKKHFKQVIKDDIFSNTAFDLAHKVGQKLQKLGYQEQAYAREINFFHIGENRRLIQKEGDGFGVEGADFLSGEVIKQEIEEHPEYFSPNVILRPVYQECILPNIAYIGGGAEIAYWGQLKGIFEHYKIPFPVLFLRNSFLNISLKDFKKLEKYNLTLLDLFLDKDNLIHQFLIKNAGMDLELKDQLKQTDELLKKIKHKAGKVDKTLLLYTEAKNIEIKKAIEKIALKMRRSQKLKEENSIKNLLNIQASILPKNNLQERYENFSSFYIQYGEKWIDDLVKNADLTNFHLQFNILE